MAALPPFPLGQPSLCPTALDCQKFCLDLTLSSWTNVSIPFSPPISPDLVSGPVTPDMIPVLWTKGLYKGAYQTRSRTFGSGEDPVIRPVLSLPQSGSLRVLSTPRLPLPGQSGSPVG